MVTWTRLEPVTWLHDCGPASASARRIVLDTDDAGSGLIAGDRGVVDEITPDGVVVEWDRGFRLSIDPQTTPYHALAAA